MRKLLVLVTAIIVLGIMASTVLAVNDAKISGSRHNDGIGHSGDSNANIKHNRFITHRNSQADREALISKGCRIIHELKGVTAVDCPEDVKVDDSENDTVFYVLDLASDRQIRADQAWALGYTGSGVTVAVLDTGVDTSSPELASNIVGGMSFVSYTTSYFDDFGHGTHVAGIITADGLAANAKGVAPNVGIWMAKVCDYSGSCYTSDIAAAIQYVVNNQIAKVISISLGGGGTTGPNCDSDYLASQINWAYDNGVVVVAAAGNGGSSTVSSPACASKAIAVAAVDSSDNLASFSSYGNALKDHGVAAPGVSIYSTVPAGNCTLCSSTGYSYLSGTSMATPHVSAMVALMLQKNPGLAPSDIRSMIFSSSNCLNSKYGACPNIKVGYGRIDALNAVGPSQPKQYLSVSANPTSIQAGQTSKITVSTSPATPAVVVSCYVAGGLGSITGSPRATGPDGSVSVTYNAPSTATAANISCSAAGWGTSSASVTVTQPTCSGTISVSNDAKACGSSKFTVNAKNTGASALTVDINDELWADTNCDGTRDNYVDGHVWSGVSISAGGTASKQWTSSLATDPSVCYIHTIYYCSTPFSSSNPFYKGNSECWEEAAAGNVVVSWGDSEFQCTPAVTSYTAKFSQSGIPRGTRWGVTVGGTRYTSTGSSISVPGLTGTVIYAYDSSIKVSRIQYVCKSGCSGTVTSTAYSKTATYRR